MGIAVSVGGLVLILLSLRTGNWYFTIALVLIVVAATKYADEMLTVDWRKNYRTWGKGAGAELTMGRQLERLGPDFQLIHDMPTGKGNIDHVCVGPTGVFVIETKASTGTLSFADRLLVNGKEPEKDYLKQLWAEVFYVRDLLRQTLGRDYVVEGILQFPNALADGSIKSKKQGLWIGGRGFANFVIRWKGTPLAKDEIPAIVAALRPQSSVAVLTR